MSVEHAVNPASDWLAVLQRVELAVKRGLDRCRHEQNRAAKLADFGQRCARMAVLYERDARWWGILARHCCPWSPYLRAVIAAEDRAAERAERYRDIAAAAAARAEQAASSQTDARHGAQNPAQVCAELGEHDPNSAQRCDCGQDHPLPVCARCLYVDDTECATSAGGGDRS